MVGFSIIIPACNEERYIIKTLSSISNQSFKDYELIIVCNGCIDNTFQISNDFLKKSNIKNYKIFNIPQAGVCKAKNFGSRFAKKEYLVFLDSDTYINQKDFLKTLSRRLDDNVVATVKLKSDSRIIDAKIYEIAKNMYTNRLTKGINACLIISRKKFYKTGLFDGSLKHKEFYHLFKRMKQNKIVFNYKCFKDLSITHSSRRILQLGIMNIIFFWLIKSFFWNEYRIIR